MIVCGKRFSLCCSFISAWAIVMLTVMGVLLYSHSLAFAEDLELEDYSPENAHDFIKEAYIRYESAAHNCWIAVCLYIATLAISMQQYWMNRKVQYGI
ncbi:Ribonuclease kappa [Halotydeus destructor]|nr:Ribonuclease kappa [Halotydeus destructor]